MPEDVKKCEVHQEKHYSVSELAERWGLSPDTIRRLFSDEPGVLVLPKTDGKRTHRRRYTTLRIPESVALRVHLRLSPSSPATTPHPLPKSVPITLQNHGGIPLPSHAVPRHFIDQSKPCKKPSQQDHMRGNGPDQSKLT